jgi:hypothetical protein
MQWVSRISAAAIVAAACLTPLVGCGYPAAAPANQELITSLRTALSARNNGWLTGTAEKVEKRHTAGTMGDEEYEAFQRIIEMARAGDWEGAEQASVDFQRAQRPTQEQIEAVEKRAR